MSIPKLSVENPVLSNLLMILIIVAGTYAMFTIPVELLPEIVTHSARIVTFYPGASPEEIEKLVTVPIEDAIEPVDKIDLILSNSSESRSLITIQFEDINDREFDKRLQDLRDAVSRIKDLPPEILDDPEVIEIDASSSFPVLTIAIGGEIDEKTLKETAENLRDEILKSKIPNTALHVSDVQIAGLREREIWIELNPDRLRSFNISINNVVNALRTRNVNLPVGKLEVGSSEYLVRTIGEFRSVSEIAETIIKIGPNSVRLGDIAKITDTYEEPLTLSRINGTKSISLTLQKKQDGNTLKLVDGAREIVENFRSRVPDGIEIDFVNDSTVILRERISILTNNAIVGLVLVTAMLWLFIGWRNAFFAALGIPVAFMATFWFLKQIGHSINGPSLFGLILVIGIVVDDAIVVIENIYRKMQEGMSPHDAAIVGANEVGLPVLSASLTTIAVFGPLMLVSGTVGQFLRVVPITAVTVLIASLIEVFGILPSHLAEWSGNNGNEKRKHWFDLIRREYTKWLAKAMRRRYVIVALVLISGLIISVFAVTILDKELFPGEDFPQFYIKVEMPTSFGIRETSETMAKIEAIMMSFPKGEIVASVTNIGLQTPTSFTEGASVRSNIGEVLVELIPKDQRKRSRDEIIEDLRKRIENVSGPVSIFYDKLEGGPPTGKDIEVKVLGPSFEKLREIADRLKTGLSDLDGVNDIQDDFQIGKSELRIKVKEKKADQFMLNVFLIASSVRSALDGVISTTYRTDDEAIDVVVKYDKKSLQTIEALLDLPISTPIGGIVPLRDVAEITQEQGVVEIKRFDNARAITVSATVDRSKTTAIAVNQELIKMFSNIETLYPGYQLDFRGEFDQFIESFKELRQLFVIGVLIMYMILGTQFKSFLQPIVILFAVPFGVIGAMIGLLAVGATLSFIAMFGIVALTGIVVNDSIVLIDFINRKRKNGGNVWRAIVNGSGLRLRPILLTSITTIVGLIPTAIGMLGKSPIWMPIASTIIFGLLFSTFLTLFVMPLLYGITVDLTTAKSQKPII